MPGNAAQWAFFLFFVLGSFGGLMWLVERLHAAFDYLRTQRHIGAVIKSMEDR